MAYLRLFVLGDSISIHYGPYLKKFIGGEFAYNQKRGEGEASYDLDTPVGANGGDSTMVLKYLNQMAAEERLDFDLLLLNCGLHDVKTSLYTDEKQVSIADYKKNLESICTLLSDKPARLLWVRTTPVDDVRHARYPLGFRRFNADVVHYNEVADQIMLRNKCPVIDLYEFSERLGIDAYCDHVHFTETVRLAQGAFIAGFLHSMLQCESLRLND